MSLSKRLREQENELLKLEQEELEFKEWFKNQLINNSNLEFVYYLENELNSDVEEKHNDRFTNRSNG